MLAGGEGWGGGCAQNNVQSPLMSILIFLVIIARIFPLLGKQLFNLLITSSMASIVAFTTEAILRVSFAAHTYQCGRRG